MKKSHPPLFNTAHATYKRRWPLKADYLDVPHPQAVSFIEDFGAHLGLECLRERGNFRQMSSIEPRTFDPLDLHQALEVVIDTVNARCEVDGEARAFKNRLQQYFGPLTGCIAVRLCGWPFVIATKAVMH